MNKPRIIIVAGPNGAGKTTFAREFLPHEAACRDFLNADLIAAGLSPFAPERAAIQAGRLMLQRMAQHVARSESFAFETTLSGLSYARQIPRWRELGYRVELIFLSLPSADVAVQRVAARVVQGGHDIPEATIRRRFGAGFRLFETVYQPLVDHWILYDSASGRPRIIKMSGDMASSLKVQEPLAQYGDQRTNDAYVRGVTAALMRAAENARRLAEQTGTDLIVMRDGKIVRIAPGSAPRKPAAP
ncbi:zeta toxin family protein [Caenimonas sp. SL110]|uniref:AAA family ATPase n=1 Tax=Caenimonas sp. SL110 TaxID=1450524 RepID=UPI000A8FAE2B|nr:zeta toxin family protein [Caenimonas sp. SL110]